MIFSKVITTGSALPKKILTNNDLAELVDTSDEWITTRTGIKQRHIAEEGLQTSDLATSALQNALDSSGVKPTELDGIIISTTTPDMVFPATAVKVQKNIGTRQGFAFDIQAVCSGFLYALQIADSFILQGKVKKIAVIGADIMSKIVDWQDRNTCVLFGDGAGAVILEATEGKVNKGILATEIFSDGALMDVLTASGGLFDKENNQKIVMNGREVFKNAVARMGESIEKIINDNGKNIADIDFLLLHQANYRIIKAVAERLSIDKNKVLSSVHHHANTSAASIPLCLDEYMQKQLLSAGSLVVSAAAGAGFTWGAALFYI
jgi:3-oxoacyl-[acyl-carrier-protein] synthase-3